MFSSLRIAVLNLRFPHTGQAIVVLGKKGRTNVGLGKHMPYVMLCEAGLCCTSLAAVASQIKMMDSDCWTIISSKYLINSSHRLWKSPVYEQVL